MYLGAKEPFRRPVTDLKLQEYIKLKEEEAVKAEERRVDIIACKLVVTGKSSELPGSTEPPSAETTLAAPIASTAPTSQKPTSHSHRSR